jgi:hypothetical protein
MVEGNVVHLIAARKQGTAERKGLGIIHSLQTHASVTIFFQPGLTFYSTSAMTSSKVVLPTNELSVLMIQSPFNSVTIWGPSLNT